MSHSTTGTGSDSIIPDGLEILRLRRELNQAKQQIAQMDEELLHQRVAYQTGDSILKSPNEEQSQFSDIPGGVEIDDLWALRTHMANIHVQDRQCSQASRRLL